MLQVPPTNSWSDGEIPRQKLLNVSKLVAVLLETNPHFEIPLALIQQNELHPSGSFGAGGGRVHCGGILKSVGDNAVGEAAPPTKVTVNVDVAETLTPISVSMAFPFRVAV